MADKEQTEQETPIGTDQPLPDDPALDGVPEDASGEDSDAKTADVAATYQRAKNELNEAVDKLRREMSKLDLQKARQQARTFAEENPTLSIFLAVGAGIVVGRLVSKAFNTPPAPPPPSVSERIESRGRDMASKARHYADEVSEVVSERASEVGGEIVRRAHELGEDVSRRARELGRDVTRRAADTLSSVSDRADAIHQEHTERADHVTHVLEEAAEEIALAVKEPGDQRLSVGEALFNAAKTITVALVAKKVSDWFRRAS